MNFSHGEYEYHQSVVDNTRKMVAGMYINGAVLIKA
jgi:pyruvate kinase